MTWGSDVIPKDKWIDVTKKYTCNGKPVINLSIQLYNSLGEEVTYPVKGDVVIKKKPFTTRYEIWSLDGLYNTAFSNPSKNLKEVEINTSLKKEVFTIDSFKDPSISKKMLEFLYDSILEGLSAEDAQKFHLEFAVATNHGSDLSDVPRKLITWLLVDKQDGLISLCTSISRETSIVKTSIIELTQSFQDTETFIKRINEIYESSWANTRLFFSWISIKMSWVIWASIQAFNTPSHVKYVLHWTVASHIYFNMSSKRDSYYLKIKTKFIELLKEAR